VFISEREVNAMLDLVKQETERVDSTFLNPATKSGVLLREVAKRLMKGLEKQIPDLQERVDYIFQKQLFGIAITEITSLLARRSLYCSKYSNSNFSVTKFRLCLHELSGIMALSQRRGCHHGEITASA